MSDSDLLDLALLFSSNYGQKSHLGVLIQSLTWGIKSAAELWKTLDKFSVHESLQGTKKQQHVCWSTDSYTHMSVVKHAEKAFSQRQAIPWATQTCGPPKSQTCGKFQFCVHGRQYPGSRKHLIICFSPPEFLRGLKCVLIFKRCLSVIDFKYMLKCCPQYKWFLKPGLMGVLSLVLIRAEKELKNFRNPKCLSKLNVYMTIRKV